MYDYYFESDFGTDGHRHNWEHIAVWVQNGELKFVSASEHGSWNTRFPGQNPQIRFKGARRQRLDFGWYLDQSRYYCVTELECPGSLAPALIRGLS
ncbi:hypothetical protein N657DRAFT_579539 [Parathielavia appendiculata]|uniref:Uncharacterized protein n=1 Tax=Parathielavia appendiculata TaxID=2587402 RepID=A0AAN6TTR7_9PEZI|nr:hypothetical protein N657DRAFT_579539 [Parathielavia appendiculata]